MLPLYSGLIANLIPPQDNWGIGLTDRGRPSSRIGATMRESVEPVETYDLPDLEPLPATEQPEAYRLLPPYRDRFDDLLEWLELAYQAAFVIGWYCLSGLWFALKILLVLIVTVTVAAVALTLPLRWHSPGETEFMRANPTQPVVQQWVDLKHMSRYPLATVIVLEDVDFGDRALAFDVPAFIDTAKRHMNGEEVDGGSTIPQQLVKNIYLSENKSAWRKAPEALLAMTFNAFVPEARQMELYFNYAQFGPNLYGLCAASWYYFNTPPWSLSEFQSAQLVSVLTFPSEARRAKEGGIYVLGPKSSAVFNYKVYEKAPNDLAWVGGYEPLMERIGIEDTASDHSGERDEDSCSSMPAIVRDLLVSDGFG